MSRHHSSDPSASPELAQLYRVARRDRLDRLRWINVFELAESQGQTLARLGDQGEPVPRPPSPNPLISALRRLVHPSSALPLSHRHALACFDANSPACPPLAFARLVVEEARTFMWRNDDSRFFAELASFLEKGALAGLDAAAAAALAARALIYLALFEARCLVKSAAATIERMWRALAKIAPGEIHELAWLPAAVHLAGAGQTEKAVEAMKRVGAWLKAEGGRLPEPAQHEHAAEVAMIDVWVVAMLGADDVAATLAEHALEVLGSSGDGWLRLNLRHDAARAILGPAGRRLEVGDEIANELSSLDMARDRKFEWLHRKLRQKVEAEREPLDRAIAHLEQASPLVAEYSGREGKIQQCWLEGAAYQFRDPVRAAESLLAALDLTKSETAGRPARMALDLMRAVAQLERAPADQRARVDRIIDRAAKQIPLVSQRLDTLMAGLPVASGPSPIR